MLILEILLTSNSCFTFQKYDTDTRHEWQFGGTLITKIRDEEIMDVKNSVYFTKTSYKS
jgi:hypothetical protein